MLRFKNVFLNTIIATAVVSLLLFPFPAASLWWSEAFNSGHVVLFVFLSIYTYCQLAAKYPAVDITRLFAFIFAAGILFGVAIELLQNLVHRGGCLHDVYLDGMGIVAGFFIIGFINNYQHRKFRAVILLVSAGVLLFYSLLPLLQITQDYLARNRAFPVLVDFDASWASSFVQFNNAERRHMETVHSLHNDKSEHEKLFPVLLKQGVYPGLTIKEPVADWSKFKNLRFKILSANKEKFKLVIRVHDNEHNQAHSDRFNKSLIIEPGLNDIVIAIADIQKGPAQRNLDMSSIAAIILFVSKLDAVLPLEISNLTLE